MMDYGLKLQTASGLKRRCRVLWEGETFAGVEPIVARDEMSRLVAFHVPALGEHAGNYRSPCSAAIVVMAGDDTGHLYCLDAWMEVQHPSSQVEKALHFWRKWGFKRLYLERNPFYPPAAEAYREVFKQQDDSLFEILGLPEFYGKRECSAVLASEIAKGSLWFADSLSPHLVEQFTLPSSSGNQDGPYALLGAIRLANPADASDSFTWELAESDVPLSVSHPHPVDLPHYRREGLSSPWALYAKAHNEVVWGVIDDPADEFHPGGDDVNWCSS